MEVIGDPLIFGHPVDTGLEGSKLLDGRSIVGSQACGGWAESCWVSILIKSFWEQFCKCAEGHDIATSAGVNLAFHGCEFVVSNVSWYFYSCESFDPSRLHVVNGDGVL